MRRKGIVFRHLLLWMLYIGFEVAYLHVTVATMSSLTHFLVYYLLNIGLFYFHAMVVLDVAFFKNDRSYLVAALLVFPEIILYLAIKVLLDSVMATSVPGKFQLPELGKAYVMANLWRGVYFIGMSTAYFSTLYMIYFKDRNHQVETERLRTQAANLELENRIISVENAFLQTQISPHILFNTLNFIYNAVEGYSEKAGKGVMYLSELMRYSLISTTNPEQAALSGEVKQIENLVALSRLRFGDGLQLSFTVTGMTQNLTIMPLMLITLVENVLKHGDIGDPAYPAQLQLNVMPGSLMFKTSNKRRLVTPHLNSGIGLKNLEKRLHNFYPGKYALMIDDQPDLFSVTLNIIL